MHASENDWDDESQTQQPSALSVKKAGSNLFLPPAAVPFIAIFLLTVPLTLLSVEAMASPFWDWIQGFMSRNIDSASGGSLPVHFYALLVLTLALLVFGVSQMMLRIKAVYIAAWSPLFPRPHRLHVPYHPSGGAKRGGNKNAGQSFWAVLNWQTYRQLLIYVPPAVCVGLMGLTVLLELFLFRLLSGLAAFSLPVQFSMGLFLLSVVGILVLAAVLHSLWIVLTTAYGDIAAITEPELDAKTIQERCQRLVLHSPMIGLLYTASILFWALVVVQIVLFFTHASLDKLFNFQVNLPLIMMLEVLSLAGYLGLTFLKFVFYHKALMRYYHKLPGAFKKHFKEPELLEENSREASETASATRPSSSGPLYL